MPSINSPVTSQEALFQAFSWHTEKHQPSSAKLAELSKDISCGIVTVLQLVEFDDHEAQDQRPLLNRNHRSRLLRLAMASATLLADTADREIERRNEQSQPQREAGN